jgi:hypothetical protein
MAEREHKMNQSLGFWAAGLRRIIQDPSILQINQEKQVIRDTLPRLPGLVDELMEKKVDTLQRLKEMKLPHFAWNLSSTQDFIVNSLPYFAAIPSDIYYATFEPANSALVRQERITGKGEEEIRNFVTSAVSKYGHGKVLLMETAPMLYGFNIVIGKDDDNPILGEIVKGTHSDLVGAQQPIVMTMRRRSSNSYLIRPRDLEFNSLTPKVYIAEEDNVSDPNERIILTPEEDTEVRKAMYNALKHIPHSERDNYSPEFEIRAAQFVPGYYEGALLDLLRPVYIDCSTNSAFIPQTL